MRVVIAAVRNRTAGFRSVTPKVVERHRETLCQDFSSILTHLDSLLAASAPNPLVKTSSDLFGPVWPRLHRKASNISSKSQ